jgi:WD40 repeat protein
MSPLSPDGRSAILVARSQRWLVSLPNGERRALRAEESTRTRSIAWLPDSRHFVAAEETTTPIGSRIVLQDTRSAARHLIVSTADFIHSIATTPDGSAVIYAGGPVERDIAEYSEAGRFIRMVAASSMLEGFPAWARTGDRFAYRTGGPGQTNTLWMATLDGAAPRLIQRLTSNAPSQTPISPDGKRIAYTDGTGIHVVSVSGGRAVRVLATTRVSATLCWTPDGDWIWFSEGPARLGRVPSAGGEPQFVQANPGPLMACSPDGRSFLRLGTADYVITSSNGKSERMLAPASEYATRGDTVGQFSGDGTRVYLLRRDRRTIDVFDVQNGGRLKPITFDTPIEDQIEGFSFSPDGTRVLLTTGGDRNDLWMARGFAHPASGWKRFFTHWDVPGTSER